MKEVAAEEVAEVVPEVAEASEEAEEAAEASEEVEEPKVVLKLKLNPQEMPKNDQFNADPSY